MVWRLCGRLLRVELLPLALPQAHIHREPALASPLAAVSAMAGGGSGRLWFRIVAVASSVWPLLAVAARCSSLPALQCHVSDRGGGGGLTCPASHRDGNLGLWVDSANLE